ncbi:putative pectinesterase inhibitor domain-containing protein [Lupinus albus]|uniref:Putative pectinesterase inhibitor domain-containing protein n=1 Tax=Lupinus albus TaxID=3870 RepID=A0A6A4PIY0_LUPAL|nr:putative pectinesterase inhibitor domain-containing protein [Lupinus albus]
MKTITSITLILSLQTLLFMISISSSNAKTFFPNDITQITFTCSHTPYPNQCVASLILYPGSDKLAVYGLAGVLLNNAIRLVANTAIEKIHQLQKAGVGLKQGLASCASKYNAILVTHIPQANAAFEKGDFKGAELGAIAAANEASSCETVFPGHLTEENTNTRAVAADAAAVVKTLHRG